LATALPAPDIPGLIGDIASLREPARIDTSRSATVAPDMGDGSSERTELFIIIDGIFLSDAANKDRRRRFQRASFDRRYPAGSYLQVEIRERKLNTP
jgi:hypothetical protein